MKLNKIESLDELGELETCEDEVLIIHRGDHQNDFSAFGQFYCFVHNSLAVAQYVKFPFIVEVREDNHEGLIDGLRELPKDRGNPMIYNIKGEFPRKGREIYIVERS